MAGFGVFRQVLCQVIADLDPSLGEQREDQGAEVEEKDEISSVHDGSGQFFEKGWFVGLLVHGATSALLDGERKHAALFPVGTPCLNYV